MENFKSVVDKLPTELKERVMGLKDVPQRTDYHPEGDTYVHSEIVTNRLIKLNDINMTMSGVFHDIGKDVTTFEKTNSQGITYPTAPGHEYESAKLVKEYSSLIESFGANPSIVYEVVYYHMRIKQYVNGSLKKEQKRARIESLNEFNRLILFAQADTMTKIQNNARIPFLDVDTFTFSIK